MTNQEFIKNALRTETTDLQPIQQRLQNPGLVRLLHASMGLVTEGGELADALKKHIFYGKPLDVINIAEEMGDVMWYMAILCDELNLSLESVIEHVINKLKVRYPNKFAPDKALERNLNAERESLEAN